MNELIGIVRNGEFLELKEIGASSRLTTIDPQEAAPPETGEIRLEDFEGKVIRIQGLDHGGWIYSTAILSKETPINEEREDKALP